MGRKLLIYLISMVMILSVAETAFAASTSLVAEAETGTATGLPAYEEGLLQKENSSEEAAFEEPETSETEPVRKQVIIKNSDASRLNAVSEIKAWLTDGGVLLGWSDKRSWFERKPLGFAIFRKAKGKNYASDSQWEFTGKTQYCYYKDESCPAAGRYAYAAAPYYDEASEYWLSDEVPDLNQASVYWINSPVAAGQNKSKSKLLVNWDKVEGASGYQIQYASTPLFAGAKSAKVKGGKVISKTITGLSLGKAYYARIRAFAYENGKEKYSRWTCALGDDFTARIKSSDWKSYNFYSQMGESVGSSGYSVCQGGCTDGKNLFYVLENTRKKNCKIAKINISKKKKVKVSSPLEIDHANSMTYNKKNNQLVVIHNKVNEKRISILDANTLKIKKSFDLQLPDSLYTLNGKPSDLSHVYGIISMDYSQAQDCYYAFTKGAGAVIAVLDSDFKPMYMIRLDRAKPDGYYYQDMMITESGMYILASGNAPPNPANTYKKCRNIMMQFDYSGKYLGKMVLKNKYEIENVAFTGKDFYAAYHTSNTFYKYKTHKRKKVKTGSYFKRIGTISKLEN